MMSPLEIREALPTDVAALAELSGQLGYPSSVQEISGRLERILGSGEHLVLTAIRPDGSVVGWIHVFIALRVESDGFAEIGGLVVTEELRGRGVGRSLLRAAEKWVADQETRKLRVRTRSTRDDARAFYERLGFCHTKQQHVYDKLVEPAR
jgi:ribosomal protein S18 acetylase RimI-like enzyme